MTTIVIFALLIAAVLGVASAMSGGAGDRVVSDYKRMRRRP